MRTQGKITSGNDDRGFGFATPLSGGKRVFVHINAFANRTRRPTVGQVVTYTISTDRQGRPCAANATLAGDRPRPAKRRRSGKGSLPVPALFLGFVALTVFVAHTPIWVLLGYLGLSAVTFIVYAVDKSAARQGGWRTPEKTLHLLALAGGWPGALVAQRKLRHKSSKQTFRSIFWFTVLLNCAVFAWTFTESGAEMLHSLSVGLI